MVKRCAGPAGSLGLFVIEGLIARVIRVDRFTALEFCPGDMLRSWT